MSVAIEWIDNFHHQPTTCRQWDELSVGTGNKRRQNRIRARFTRNTDTTSNSRRFENQCTLETSLDKTNFPFDSTFKKAECLKQYGLLEPGPSQHIWNLNLDIERLTFRYIVGVAYIFSFSYFIQVFFIIHDGLWWHSHCLGVIAHKSLTIAFVTTNYY